MLIFTKTKVESPESIEGENLAAHVILCRQREASTKARMDEIEDRQAELENRESDMRSYILKTITTAAFALLSSAVSLGMLISDFVKK
jgi:cell division protein FtsB